MVICLPLPRLLPVVCSFVAFILVMLALFAGNRPGALEEYDILTVNTSGLGKDIVNKLTSRGFTIKLGPTPTTDNVCDNLGGAFGKVCDTTTSVVTNTGDTVTSAVASAGGAATSAVADKVNTITNDIADKLANKLHIRDFYSIHALAICEGDFTVDGARNITDCHPYFSENSTAIPTLLNQTLTLHPSLPSLSLPYPLLNALTSLNTTLRALAIIYATAVGLTGLSFLCCVAGAFVRVDNCSSRDNNPYNNASGKSNRPSRIVAISVWTNLLVASAALFFLVLGGLVGTVGARVAAGRVTELGEGVGVSAVAGTGWVTLAWLGVGLMGVVLGYWGWGVRRLRRNGRTGKGREEDGVVMGGLSPLAGVEIRSVRGKGR